jgi:uncharacterized protein YaaW (UPF0174 family)
MSDPGIDFNSTDGVTSEMLSADAGIQYALTVNTEMAYSDIRKLETVLIRCLGYAEQLTGDPNLRKGLNTIQQTIVALRTLQQVMRMTMATSGPIGWAMLLTSAVATGASFGTIMMDIGE